MTRAVALLLTVVAVGAVCGCTDEEPAAGGQAPPSGADDLPAGATEAAAAGADVETFVGVVAASRAVLVTAESRGRLTHLPVKLGDELALGDVVAELDIAELRQEIASAEAALRATRAAEESARIEWQRSRQRVERRRGVSGIFSNEEVADVEAEAKMAAARVETAESQVGQHQARLEQLRERYGAAVLRAPIDGKVAVLFVQAGALVESGSPVARIVSDGEFVVRFAVPPAMATSLRVGGPVGIWVEPLDLTLPGSISQISPATDPASQMVFAEASLEAAPPAPDLLQDGQTARVTLTDRSPG